MTEEEAMDKWCPFARGVSWQRDENWKPGQWGFVSANREDDGDQHRVCQCLGSQCMAWRWTNEVTGRGFCGLAGSVGLP